MSEPLLDEFREVAARPRLRRKFRVDVLSPDELMPILIDQSEFISITGDLRLCRDPDDDMVLETAVTGRARYVMTRDDDLKADSELAARLAEHGIEVLTVRRFLALVDQPT